MELLAASQIMFNLVASLAILALALALGVIVFEVITMIRRIKKFFNDLNEKSIEAFKHLDSVLAGMSMMPFLSKWFTKKSKKTADDNN